MHGPAAAEPEVAATGKNKRRKRTYRINFLPILWYTTHKEVDTMPYCSVAETAARWKVSERTVRNYCAQGRVPGTFLTGKTWNIPADAEKPLRRNAKRSSEPASLLDVLQEEKAAKRSGGIYHRVQIELTYNSNHIEGSRLSHDQTRFIFETNTLGLADETVNVDDIMETANHFSCIDLIIEQARRPLRESLIKQLHRTLKSGTSDSRKEWFVVGDYKKLPNEVGGQETTPPSEVPAAMGKLLKAYEPSSPKTLEELVAFHHAFETIHPFQDGNGRVGRLILFKECLRNNIVPFIIDERFKLYYYRGLKEWPRERGYLLDTCLAAQDQFKKYLVYFQIPFEV